MADEDPFVGSNFVIEVEKSPVASFTELSGLKVEVEAIKSIENDTKGIQRIRMIPGAYKPQAITLKRPMDSSMQMFNWFKDSLSKTNPSGGRDVTKARGNMSLVIQDNSGTEKARYNLTNAWISSHDVGSVKAADNTVMTETVTIQVETMERIK